MSKKAPKAADGTHHVAVHEDEMHVTRTTPQGTQEAGVDKGHELRDILIRPTLGWFLGLLIGTIITIVAMWVLMSMLASADRVTKDELSSPLYVTEHTKRVPELLPNPEQGENQKMPWDHMADFRKGESKELKNHGLEDAQGYPALPVNAVNQVLSEAASHSQKPAGDQEMPSDSTGGQSEAISILTK